MDTDVIELGVEYPATTRTPPARTRGMAIHQLIDISAYAGTPQGDRYDAAGGDAERAAALADMPKATVTFVEVPRGEDFFALSPPEFLDHLAQCDTEKAEDRAPCIEPADPA